MYSVRNSYNCSSNSGYNCANNWRINFTGYGVLGRWISRHVPILGWSFTHLCCFNNCDCTCGNGTCKWRINFTGYGVFDGWISGFVSVLGSIAYLCCIYRCSGCHGTINGCHHCTCGNGTNNSCHYCTCCRCRWITVIDEA